jgi:hypothetical protein
MLFRTHSDRLNRELDLEPSRETWSLAGRIRDERLDASDLARVGDSGVQAGHFL